MDPIFLSWQEFEAGWIAGVCGLACSHPVDTIKVRLQEGQSTMLQTVKSTYKYEGIFGFFKGMGFPALMAGAQNAVFFGTYSNLMRLLINYKHENSEEFPLYYTMLISGNGAGLVQVIATTPVEIVKIKLQTTKNMNVNNPYNSITQTIKYIYLMKGFRGLYHGFIPTALRDVPSGGLYITFYHILDQWLQQYIPIYWSHMLSGGVAGTLSYAPMIPFDVIKTRMQADSLEHPEYNGIMDCIMKSYKMSGYACFWRGIVPYCVRAFASNAVIFICYEYCLLILP